MLPDLLHVAIFRFPKKLNCKKFLLLNQLLLLFKVNGCNSTNEHAGNMLYHNRPHRKASYHSIHQDPTKIYGFGLTILGADF